MFKIAVFALVCALLAIFMLTIRTFSIIPIIGVIGIFYSLWWPFKNADEHAINSVDQHG